MSQEQPIVIDDESTNGESVLSHPTAPNWSSPVSDRRQYSHHDDASTLPMESPRQSQSPSEGISASQATEGEVATGDDSILAFEWRKTAKLKSSKSSAGPSISSQPSYYMPTSQSSQVDDKEEEGEEEEEGEASKKKKKKPKRSPKEPKPPKVKAAKKKNAKSEQEKLEIAVALGKYRHLEVRVLGSEAFFRSTPGASLEYFLIEHDRALNVKKIAWQFDNALFFQRRLLELNPEGVVMPSEDKFFIERIAIILWSGLGLIQDLKSNEGRSKRIAELRAFKEYLELAKKQALPCEHSVRVLLILEDCDGAVAQTRFSFRSLEQFLVSEVEIGLGINYSHVSNPHDIATLLYDNFHTVERWPYRKSERAFDYLDNVKRLKSFSASAAEGAAAGERVTNRAIDGIQLKAIWTNMLISLPRVGQTAGEGMAASFPSIRSFVRVLEDDPREAEEALSNCRSGVRREHKLARTICTLFTSDDPDLRLA